MASFNIQDFKSETGQRGGFMRPNRFKLTFGTPPILIGNPVAPINRNIEYWCDSALLPGYLIGTSDVRRWTYGPAEKRPFMPNFTQFGVTFQSDANANIWLFFNEWMQQIIPHDTRNGFNSTLNGRYAYELEYKTNYVTDLNLFVYDMAGDQTLNIVLKEAFPSQLPDMQLNWGMNNQIARFMVVFDYLDWFVQPPRAQIAGV